MNKTIDPNDDMAFQSLALVIYDVARLLRRSFDRRSTNIGMSRTFFSVLVALRRHKGVRQVELAEIMELKPITIVRLLDKLEAEGYIERRDDPEDRRAKRLHLTAKAEPLLEQLKEIGAMARQEALGEMSEADHEALMGYLFRVRDNLNSASPKKRRSPSRKSVLAE